MAAVSPGTPTAPRPACPGRRRPAAGCAAACGPADRPELHGTGPGRPGRSSSSIRCSSAVYFSFTTFDLINPPQWVGLRNWKYLLAGPERAAVGRENTLWLVVVLVPARMIGALVPAACC